MEGETLNEQVTQESGSEVVQIGKKRRSQAEKYGRLRWIEILVERLDGRLDRIEGELRVIRRGFEGAGYLRFSVPMVQRYACVDIVDLRILETLRIAGHPGMFPKDVAGELPQHNLRYYDVSRRIVRMNKRLKAETGEQLFEKRGHKWALTSFAVEVWGATENEVEEQFGKPA